MVRVQENLTDKRFGLLKVIQQAEDYVSPSGKYYPQWLCECDCENHTRKIVRESSLKSGYTTSCGCIAKIKLSQRAKKNTKENPIDWSGEFPIGYTLKGEEFGFDTEDYEKIKEYCWYYDNSGYLRARERGSGKNVYFHILVMEPVPSGMVVDHKLHPPYPEKKIDNRKSNLRYVTESENQQNKHIQSNNTSGVKGVFWHKRDECWISVIQKNGIQYSQYFHSFDDAVKWRKKKEVELFGEYNLSEQ